MSKLEFDEQEEYIGNIWGWKISFIGLAFILLMLAVMIGRYYYLVNTGEYYPDQPQDPFKTEIND